MGRFRFIFSLQKRLSRVWELVRLPSIPRHQHIVRVCKPKYVEDGEIIPQAFEPKVGEFYLSVHWLEYFQKGVSFQEGFDRLRDFLASSALGDLKPQKKGKLAALRVGCLGDSREEGIRVNFKCKHAPRVGRPWLKAGEGHLCTEPGFDPHSGIYTFPWKGAEQLAVQQFLLSKVIYEEVAKK